MASFCVIVSVGGVSFTERSAPTKMVSEGVAMMATFGGTVNSSGATATASSARCSSGAGAAAS